MRGFTIVDWANEINDDNLHHIGEYYGKVFQKAYKKKNGGLTLSFHQWMIKMEIEDGFAKPISEILEKFQILRDWDGTFFARRK